MRKFIVLYVTIFGFSIINLIKLNKNRSKDYNIMFNTETNEFYLFDDELPDNVGTLEGDDTPSALPVLTTQPYNGNLYTSAQSSVTSSNLGYDAIKVYAEDISDDTPEINTIISEEVVYMGVNMAEELPIVIVKTKDNSTRKPEPDGIVKRQS
jgi:hypothetical protein